MPVRVWLYLAEFNFFLKFIRRKFIVITINDYFIDFIEARAERAEMIDKK